MNSKMHFFSCSVSEKRMALSHLSNPESHVRSLGRASHPWSSANGIPSPRSFTQSAASRNKALRPPTTQTTWCPSKWKAGGASEQSSGPKTTTPVQQTWTTFPQTCPWTTLPQTCPRTALAQTCPWTTLAKGPP